LFLLTDYASVIRPLQIVVLAVAGLFLLRVMRVAMVQVRPPKERGVLRSDGGRQRERRTLGLEFIEPDSHAGQRITVAQPVTIGRNVGCDVMVEDTYLSGRHATLHQDDGDLTIEDLGSTNGTYVNQELIKHRTRLERGDIVQVGGVLFEVVR
jgi:pSer/pThr/pTyr-binding forkhead associated (FHA) protein